MAKLTGPLLSLIANGTIGKTITYGWNKGTAWLRRWVEKKYTRTLGQDTVRKLFQEGLTKWNEVFKVGWGKFNELGVDDIQLWECFYKGKEKGGRCGYMSEYMICKGPFWEYYPAPRPLNKINVTSQITFYDELIADLETLTELTMCKKPTVLSLPLTISRVAGWALAPGRLIGVRAIDFDKAEEARMRWLLVHELTHCLLMQHGYYQFFFVHTDHEAMANECADRVVAGELTPIYTYKGKTMSEIVPFPSCP